MFRLHFLAWTAALALVGMVTPEIHAQKGKGGGGGGARGGAHISPARGASPARGGISPGAIRSSTVHPGAVHPPTINNGIHINPSQGLHVNPAQGLHVNPGQGLHVNPGHGISGSRPSAGFTPQTLRGNNFGNGQYPNSRFDTRHFNDHNRGGSSFFFYNPLGFWPGAGWYPYSSYYDPFPSYYGYGGFPSAGYVPNVTPGYDPNFVPPPPVPTATTMAQIDVFVPDPNAQVWFDGTPTTSKGSTRYFDSPPLQAGSNYTYSIRVVWNQGGQAASAETAVSVTAGAQVVVDFTQSPPKVIRVN